MFYTSYLELSRSALAKNYRYLRELVGPDVKISTVVKGNAYGHGIEPFIRISQECGNSHFSVYSADEAFRVSKTAFPGTEVLIMGWLDDAEVEWAVENDVQFFVFKKHRLDAAIKAAKKLKKPAYIHIELETGMNRTGFVRKELQEIVPLLHDNMEHLVLEGLCTHYAGAESIANFVRVQKQLKEFKKQKKWLESKFIKPRLCHTASSAATISFPKMRMDMVRVGILCYGFWPSRETFISHISKKRIEYDPLDRVISWKSIVMSVKTVKMGEFVGYGNHFLAQRQTKIALVPVGYSHGYSRSLTNTGKVLIRGQVANVLGTVNMNLIIVDVTDIPGVERGDAVVLIGTQQGAAITVHSFSEMAEQLNYELLTRLPLDLPRNIVD